jgi:hypothetical protein
VHGLLADDQRKQVYIENCGGSWKATAVVTVALVAGTAAAGAAASMIGRPWRGGGFILLFAFTCGHPPRAAQGRRSR